MKKIIFLLLSVFLTLNFAVAQITDLYIIGNASTGGWDANPNTMDGNKYNGYYQFTNNGGGIFTWTGNLLNKNYGDNGNARFKFIPVHDSWDNSLTCENGSHVLANSGESYSLFPPGSGDNGFQVAKTGEYTITVNVNTMTMVCTLNEAFEPDLNQLYLVGNGSANGWGHPATTMVKEREGVFRVKANFNSGGDFKFLSLSNAWAPSINPVGFNGGANVTFTVDTDYQLKYRKYESDEKNKSPGDNKFVAPASGTYYIKVDLNQMIMRISTTPFTLVIGTEDEITMSQSNYTNGGYGDIIFQSDDSNTGQLTITGGSLNLTGAAKIQKTFGAKKWYALGFPFNIAAIYSDNASYPNLTSWNGSVGDFWLRTYDGTNDKFDELPGASALTTGGYAFQVPNSLVNHEITFVSAPNVTLSNSGFGGGSGYALTNNPSVANLTIANTPPDYFYVLEATGQPGNFGLLAAAYDLKPFESVVVAKGITGNLRAPMNVDVVTSLPALDLNGEKVVATEYYNLQGVKIAQPQSGSAYIIKSIYESGKTQVVKQIK